MAKEQAKYKNELNELLEASAVLSESSTYEGYITDDKNLPNHILVVESNLMFYSFNKNNVIRSQNLGDNRYKVWVTNGAKAYRSTIFTSGIAFREEVSFLVGMEDIAPPVPLQLPGSPIMATKEDIELLKKDVNLLVPSISSVASNFRMECAGGDSYQNNCAHFLSNAFIKTGYSELYNNNPHINARCATSAKRPVRARDMWTWFQSKAVRTSRTLQRNTGWWCIFQLKESEYWGGHVVILDSNGWKYYGTGWYHHWDQYLYQW